MLNCKDAQHFHVRFISLQVASKFMYTFILEGALMPFFNWVLTHLHLSSEPFIFLTHNFNQTTKF